MSKRKTKMTDLEATMIAEGAQEAESDEQYIAAWQHLIDSGLCWRLQGWFGRTARAMIDEGYCCSPDGSSDISEPPCIPSTNPNT